MEKSVEPWPGLAIPGRAGGPEAIGDIHLDAWDLLFFRYYSLLFLYYSFTIPLLFSCQSKQEASWIQRSFKSYKSAFRVCKFHACVTGKSIIRSLQNSEALADI